jgi:phosphoglycolate phosphatase
MSYKYVIFDLDGTLTDSAVGITNSVAYALKRWNIEVEDKSTLNCFIGPPLSGSFEKYFGFSEEQALEAVDEYRVYYRERGIFENLVYPGVPEMLQAVRDMGKKVILATSKPEHFAKQILDHFDLTKYFDLVAGATMDYTRAKKGQVIAYALQTSASPMSANALWLATAIRTSTAHVSKDSTASAFFTVTAVSKSLKARALSISPKPLKIF